MTNAKPLTAKELHRLLHRGVSDLIVESEMVALLQSGKKLRLKEGFDPTFPDIHLGHMVGLRKLRQFQEYGHHVVLIVGDWTAQIGDPTGVSVTRPILTADQVKYNAETYMKQFFKIVDKDQTEVRWQSEWFADFKLADVIKLTSKFTVAQFLARDDFNARFTSNRPIALTEFLYPLLQAYDSVMVKADVEFGGQDQKFNFLVGRELQTIMGQPPQQCLMTPLLVGTDGAHKMSKSLGNYIAVNEAPEQAFGKVMSIADNMILPYYELLTDVPDEEIAEFKKDMEAGKNPMELKKRLAGEIVTQLHNKEAAVEADNVFTRTVQKHELPDQIPEICYDISGQVDLRDLICITGLAASKSEAGRLVQQGGVSLDGEKVTVNVCSVKNGCIIKVGKRRFAKIIDTKAAK